MSFHAMSGPTVGRLGSSGRRGEVAGMGISQLEALSESTRRAICADLAGSDFSPSELAELRLKAKNTITHHLEMLNGVGLVDSRRSSGDGRQRYVSLTERGGQLFPPNDVIESPTFVCWNGAERSQLAATIWHRLAGQSRRAYGIQPIGNVHPGIAFAAKKAGVSFRAFRPVAIQTEQLGSAVIVVCDRAWEHWARRGRPTAQRFVHWSIPNPRTGEGGRDSFRSVVEEISKRCKREASTIQP